MYDKNVLVQLKMSISLPKRFTESFFVLCFINLSLKHSFRVRIYYIRFLIWFEKALIRLWETDSVRDLHLHRYPLLFLTKS